MVRADICTHTMHVHTPPHTHTCTYRNLRYFRSQIFRVRKLHVTIFSFAHDSAPHNYYSHTKFLTFYSAKYLC